MLAALAAAALFALGEPVAAGGAAPSPFEPVPAERPFVLLAIDGLDGDLVEALAETGRADALPDAMARGAVFPIRPRGASEPPEVWTTVATGTLPETHGVRGAGVATLPGVATPLRAERGPLPLGAALRFLLPARTAPVSGAGRSVLALWEIVGLHRPVGW